MKLKFWLGEFEFDRDDAVIVTPLILLLLSFATPLPKLWLLVGFAVYYAVLFFVGKLFEPMKKWFVKRSYRCSYCKSRHTIVLGLNDYLGDCPYYFYKCNDCGQESIDVDGTLVQPVKWKNLSSGK
jgi:DNA-directed RNA polymerase subunit RPC12/RpoP